MVYSFFYILLLCVEGIAPGRGTISTPDLIPRGMPQDLVEYYLTEGRAGESGGISEWEGRGRRFAEYVQRNWREMVDRWRYKREGDVCETVFCYAAETLDPAEYVLFLDRMLTECQAGRLRLSILGNVVAPMSFKMAFPNVNYRHPDVRRLIERYKKVLPSSETDRLKWCDDILSGALEDQLTEYCDYSKVEVLPLDVLPLSGGVKEHGYRVSPVKAVVATAKVFPQVVQTITWIEIVVLGVMAVAASWLWRLWRRIRQRTT